MHYYHLEDIPGIEKIIPERYVWHVTSPKNRRSIIRLGINPNFSKHNCVFANNQSFNIKFFFPFCVETYFKNYYSSDLLEFDFWRIDTTKFNADFYIDPNMMKGPKEFMGDEKYFITTESRIPSNAIELFTVGEKFIIKTKTVFLLGEEIETGHLLELPLKSKKNEEIKKEITEYRKTFKVLGTSTMTLYYVDDNKFPLVKMEI